MEARYEISENNDEDNDDADTYFHNGLDSYLHAITRPNKLLRISENGDITYSIRLPEPLFLTIITVLLSRLTVKAKCPMILKNFPMDQQTCALIFGSCKFHSLYRSLSKNLPTVNSIPSNGFNCLAIKNYWASLNI